MVRKEYVKVNADFQKDGTVRPRSILWEDGHVYEITRVLRREKAASLRAGGCGIRYTVIIDGKESLLFRDEDRWFVEAKV